MKPKGVIQEKEFVNLTQNLLQAHIDDFFGLIDAVWLLYSAVMFQLKGQTCKYSKAKSLFVGVWGRVCMFVRLRTTHFKEI